MAITGETVKYEVAFDTFYNLLLSVNEKGNSVVMTVVSLCNNVISLVNSGKGRVCLAFRGREHC